MTTFTTITVFEKAESDNIVSELYDTISFLQTTYCIPPVSEFYIASEHVNSEKNYVEYHIEYKDLEAYNQWFEMFGEVVEELAKEMRIDFSSKNISFTRYADDVALSRAQVMLDMSLFKSKLIDHDAT
jgi:hypothetical protein